MSTPQFKLKQELANEDKKQAVEKADTVIIHTTETLAQKYEWIIKRAFEFTDDKRCADIFISGMQKCKELNAILTPMGPMIILMLDGRALREHMCEFDVPGADSTELKKLIKMDTVRP